MVRYFFDVTALRQHLARHPRLSGIQRVSVTTINKARDRIGAENIWFGYHDRRTKTYKVCRCPLDTTADLTDYATLCALLKIRPRLRGLPGMARYARHRGLALEDWVRARAVSRTGSRLSLPSMKLDRVARPGDQMVLLDNAWYPKGLEHWIRHGSIELELDVSVLLHDLIPLVVPQYTEGDSCIRLHDWLKLSTGYVTRYLVNSENTGRDLRAFLATQGASQPVKVVPLAQSPLLATEPKSEIAAAYSALAEGALMPDHIRALTKTPYVLVVGTLEVRKNLWRIATIWDWLRRQPGRALPKLVFAGRRGWLNDDFDRLMQATGQLGGWVEIVEAPEDDVLAFLYRNCLFTVTASFYEGWGLPIGESLAYGKTAVVSNTSSMPEVGGDMVEYCDPHDPASIEAACLKLLDDPVNRQALEKRISAARLRSWEDVARDMLAAIEAQ